MKLTNEPRATSIGQIRGGQTGNQGAQHFAVDHETINILLGRFTETEYVN